MMLAMDLLPSRVAQVTWVPELSLELELAEASVEDSPAAVEALPVDSEEEQEEEDQAVISLFKE